MSIFSWKRILIHKYQKIRSPCQNRKKAVPSTESPEAPKGAFRDCKRSPRSRASGDFGDRLHKKRTRHERVLPISEEIIIQLFRYSLKVFNYLCLCCKCKHLISNFFCFFHCPLGHYLTCCKDGCWAYGEFV